MTGERRRLWRRVKTWHAPGPVAVVALALVTLPLSLIAAGPGVVFGDVTVARWVQGVPDSHLGPLFRAMNLIGETPSMLAIGAALALICWRRRRFDALALIVAASVARSANPILKAIYDSPRPSASRVRVEEVASGLGFPSGHVMGMTLFVGALVCLAWHSWPTRRHRSMTLLGAGLVLLLSGGGRIAVGAHWPTDVLGGYLYGTLGTLGLIWGWQQQRPTNGTPPVNGTEVAMVGPSRRRLGPVTISGCLAALFVASLTV